MKYFIYFLILCSLGLIGYNLTILDFNNLMEGDSSVALGGILAALCVLVLMIILLMSKKIEKLSKK